MANFGERNGRFMIQGIDETDFVKDGELYKHQAVSIIMVESSSDLTLLTDYAPGSLAYTAGFGSVWQMDADGEWVAIES